MKKILSILNAITLVGTASTSIIACGGGENPTPPVQKTNLNTETLKTNLKFTKTMNGQDAYNELRSKIKDLSNNIYNNTDEIKNDNTLSISISINSTEQLKDNITVNLKKVSFVEVKIKITDNNKAFKELDWKVLSAIAVKKSDLNTIIIKSVRNLGQIKSNGADSPTVNQIKDLLESKITNLDISAIEIKNINTTQAEIIGDFIIYEGSVNITYNVIKPARKIDLTNYVSDKTIEFYFNDDKWYVGCVNGKIYSFNSKFESSSKQEVTDLKSSIESITINDDKWYVGCFNGKIYSFNSKFESSSQQEVADLKNNVDAIIFNDDKWYVGCDNGKIYSFNSKFEKQEFFANLESGRISSITINNNFYILTDQRQILVFTIN